MCDRTYPVVSPQGPCTGNQQSLTHSRLWDAVVGFLHVFAHLMMKLAQVQATCLKISTYTSTHLSTQNMATIPLETTHCVPYTKVGCAWGNYIVCIYICIWHVNAPTNHLYVTTLCTKYTCIYISWYRLFCALFIKGLWFHISKWSVLPFLGWKSALNLHLTANYAFNKRLSSQQLEHFCCIVWLISL